MKNDIKVLENKLKKITGEDSLPYGELDKNPPIKSFNASAFTKLAKEVKKIMTEDGTYSNLNLKS
ncbi:MAG: hypothetical protein ACR2LN_00775 [Candidatus Levyibacteriota bacterium]